MLKSVTFTLLGLVSLCACGVKATEDSSGPCLPKTAIIRVGDGFISSTCGCNEGNRTLLATDNTRLDCTVTAGTEVTFSFSGAYLTHQIASINSPSFVSSPIFFYDTKKAATRSIHAVTFSTTGNFDFQDTYNSAIFGRIISQ